MNLRYLAVLVLVSATCLQSSDATPTYNMRMCNCHAQSEAYPCPVPECPHGLTKGVCNCCEVCVGGEGDKCQVFDDNIAGQGNCLDGLKCINEHIRDWLSQRIGYTVNGICKPDYDDDIEFFKQSNGWIDYRTIPTETFQRKIQDPAYKQTYDDLRKEFLARPIPT